MKIKKNCFWPKREILTLNAYGKHLAYILLILFVFLIRSCTYCEQDQYKKGAVVHSMKNDIYYCESDGYAPICIFKNGTKPKWDPKKPGRLAFIRKGDEQSPTQNNNALCIVKVDGTNFKQLTNEWRVGNDFCWLPDGQWIIFEYQNPKTGLWDIWKIRPSGMDLAPIGGYWYGLHVSGDKSEYRHPRVSPDGKWIACEYRKSTDESSIAILNAASPGSQLPPKCIPTPKGYTDENPVWHQSKNILAFTRGRTFGDNLFMGTIFLVIYDDVEKKWTETQFSDEELAWKYVDLGFCRVCRSGGKSGKWDDLLVCINTNGYLCIQPFVLIKSKNKSVPYKTTPKPIQLLEVTGWLYFEANQWGCIFTYPKWVPGTKPNIMVKNTHNNNTFDLYNIMISAEPSPTYYKVNEKIKLMVSEGNPNYMIWPGW